MFFTPGYAVDDLYLKYKNRKNDFTVTAMLSVAMTAHFVFIQRALDRLRHFEYDEVGHFWSYV